MIAIALLLGASLLGADGSAWWDAGVEASLDRAPARKAAWAKMLGATPEDRRASTAYLVRHLPIRDLKSLAPEALAENVALAEQARREAPWGKGLPDDVYLDAVLPHASVTEPRDSMRKEFHDRYLPLVSACKTPGAAALVVNASLFKDYKVGYNTRRLRTDQASRESIAQGMATCTGLSIMLVEACRAVGVPARVAGIHSWPGRGGNHTWAEVWDGGSWHFVGAAEPDPKGLDHAWFVGDASKAIAGSAKNAVYAVTYRPSKGQFPMVWAPMGEVNGEDVTTRYTKATSAPKGPRLMVEVKRGGQRVVADVEATDRATGAKVLAGKSLGPSEDVNLHLAGPAKPGTSLMVVARVEGLEGRRTVTMGEDDTVVRIDLDAAGEKSGSDELPGLLKDRFGDDAGKRQAAGKRLEALPLDGRGRTLAWHAYRESPEHARLKEEFEAKVVKTPERTSPYLWRHVGERPKEGWGLVIAMHGGGGAPKAVNDSQWEGMFSRYYKDHPEAGGYVYLALRAPNDAWNGFYDDAIGPMVERLIRQFVVFGEVNPDRVYTLGASHGGYGAFVIGTKIPDRFAAVHASASAPTPGETQGENLKNVRFTFMVGEKDTAYGRAERCQEFAKLFEGWRKERGGYAGGFEWKPGVGHSVPDREKVAEMLGAGPRDAWPREVIWVQSDDVIQDFYWVEAMAPKDGGRVEAKVEGNTIRVKAEKQGGLAFRLNGGLVDLSKPVTVEVAGRPSRTFDVRPNLGTYCDGLERRGDPVLAGSARVEVPAGT